MTILTIYAENKPDRGETFTDYANIKKQLSDLDIEFERWNAHTVLPATADQATILEAYKKSIDKLNKQYNFQSIDVISVDPNHPERENLRQKFLAEHIHEDFEIRFFIQGKGLFYLHIDQKVYAVLCEHGDLISIPSNTPHWFDMGIEPDLKCIRLFTVKEGWAANYTGSSISENFPSFDEFVATH